LKRCLYWMGEWSGGQVAPGFVDNYPSPPRDPVVNLTEYDVKRMLGIEIPLVQVKELLARLEFSGEIKDGVLAVKTPPIRMDIGDGIVGIADVMEEIARLYGYENIPESRMAEPLPPQRGNPIQEAEDFVRDTLVSLGLQEVITHRMTSPELEQRLLPKGIDVTHERDYIRLANPIAPEKSVLRRSMLASVVNVLANNQRLSESLFLFEIGSVFLPSGELLPLEPHRLAIALTGLREPSASDRQQGEKVDFYDLKGVLDALLGALQIPVTFSQGDDPTYHPGKCALIKSGEKVLGLCGELHPQVQ